MAETRIGFEVESKDNEFATLKEDVARHPIYGFFVFTCLWGVRRRYHNEYKKYLSKMIWSVLYPNVEIFQQFFQNNNSITNMKEIYKLFCNIYKNIDIVNQGRFYNDSDIWTQSDRYFR